METSPNFKAKKRTPSWFIALLGITLIGGVLGLFAIFSAPGINDAVEYQLKLLREHRITQAYYDTMSKNFQENTSLEEFREFASLYPVLSRNKTFRIENSKVTDGMGIVTGTLVSDEFQEMQAEYRLIEESGSWKVLGMRLHELESGNEEDPVLQEMASQVMEQLQVLRKGEITDAYYGYVSKDFQQETPFEEFQDFVRSNPVLTSFNNIEVKNTLLEGRTGYADLILSTGGSQYYLEYKLQQENDAWKVWSLRVVLPPEVSREKAATNPEALKPPVRELLEALQLDRFEKAYYNTAKEFQEATTYSAFEEFILSNPALSRRDLTDFKTGMIESGVGRLQVNLHDDEGITKLEFKLGFDEGYWKIWGIHVLETPDRTFPEENSLSDRSVADSMIAFADMDDLEGSSVDIDVPFNDIKKIRVSDEVDDKGLITTPRIVIDSGTQMLYINVTVEDGKKDSQITLILSHIDSGTSAPPLNASIKQDGTSIISFSYDAPENGWPQGNYIIKATSSPGDEHLQKFQLRQGEKKYYSKY